MKNKIICFIFAFIASFSFINKSYCQLQIDDGSCSLPFDEAPIIDYNCGVSGAYRYMSLGVGPIVFIPNIGLGYRERYSQWGWDAALSFSTLGYAHQLSAHVVAHYYLSHFRKNSAYLGLGLMGSEIFTNHEGNCSTLSTDFVFGKELGKTNDCSHFIEMHVAIPTMYMDTKHPRSMYFPLMYIKYGMSF